MLRRRRAAATAIAGLVVIASVAGGGHGLVGSAAGDDLGPVAGPAQATAQAVRMRQPTTGDLVSVYEVSGLSSTTVAAAHTAAAAAGASSTLTRGFTTGLLTVRRGGTVVQQASGPSGLWQIPMGVSVMPIDAMRVVMGDRVAGAIGAGTIAMGETAAGMRGAAAGDVVELLDANGGVVSFTIGVVAADAEVGGTEIVMSPEQAAQLGPVDPTRVLVYGTFDRTALDVALGEQGLYDTGVLAGRKIRIRRSWSPPDPDSQIGLARTKALLGEFDVTIGSSGAVSVDADWRERSIVRAVFADIGIRSYCHVAIVDDIQAALTEIAQAGLAFAIDLVNTNSYGGCYYPRFNRITGNLGFLSRHSWGQALDMNTVTNAQGRVPQMDCRVVRIFRKHGFIWGGNFLNPDGMHFEWVGEPRDQLAYPSPYCPNQPAPTSSFAPWVDDVRAAADTTVRDSFFAGDGWGDGSGIGSEHGVDG